MAAICTCGKENPDGAKFCLECGSAIVRTCTGCGTQLPVDAKFCLECGQPVGATPEPMRRESRKVVSVVFVDLAGSTSLQEHMDPESVRRVMERFYATMRAEVEAAGGVVVKFTGDGVMAGFGIREVGEDDALRAVRSAASMQQSFAAFARELNETRGAVVSLRVGINSGEVVVSDEDDDVVGDVVNVAARLEHAAGDGNVLVGEETWRLTRHAVTYEAVPDLELKGKAEAVRAYRLVSLEPPDEDAGSAPFVGRRAELGRLHDVFETTASAGKPSIVTIIGSPGLGKTRLASEFVASVSHRARVLEARCDPAGTATYAPIAEALREAAGISETAADDAVVSALRALLPEGYPEQGRIAKAVASLLGVGEPTAPQETFWAVRRLMEGLAGPQPVVVVVDDVQWAEPMLLDLFDHVVEWAKDTAIFIVALARPEIRDHRPALADSGAVVLEGLGADDTAALALSLLGAHDLPADLVRRILATTEGNPLFVRELLRMLVDDGVLSHDGDRWVITVEADEIDVPPTIHALLSARIERLREEERAILERASVVGQEFYRGAVMELVPPTVRAGVDAHLETLRRKELVEPEGTYWIDERVFRFHHVLIRDAAYRRLLKEARAELHERFADWLEAKVGELVGEHEEVLGYHLEQAHLYLSDLGALDAHGVDLGRRASVHLASAARRALDRDDLAAAANLSGRALALTEDEDARARILLDRCEALLAMGDVAAATEAVSALRRQASDERLRAWADCFDGELAILTDPARLHETAEVVQHAARRLAELDDSAGAAKAHAVHAQALAHLGQFGTCETALDRALAAARQAGDRRRANAVLARAPFAALWGPSPVPRASGRCLDVVRVLRITAGAPAVEATALRCQAALEAMRGRSDAARRMLASARQTLEELGLRHALLECDLFAGLIDLLSGEPVAAEASLRTAYQGFRALNVGTDAAQAAALLARSLVEQGRDDEALLLTEESERLGGDDLKTAIAWRTVRARVLARRSDVETAEALARSAVAIAEATDALVDHAEARAALAEVLSAAGRVDEADVEAAAGRELYERKEVTFDGGRAAAAGRRPEVAPSARVEDRVSGVRTAAGVSGDDIVAVLSRYRRALLDGDWEAMAELHAEDYGMVDHRSGLRSQVDSGAAWVEAMRATWRDVESDWAFEVLARWSEGVGLVRAHSLGAGWERTFLVVLGLRGGLAWRGDMFDEADHQSAFARLDELAYELSPASSAIARYVAEVNGHGWTDVVGVTAAGDAAVVHADGSFAVVTTSDGELTAVETCGGDELAARRRLQELAPSPSYMAWATLRYYDRHTHQDWEALRSLIAPDIVVIDHRRVGWGTVTGMDRLLELLQEGARTFSMAPDELRITEWLAITEDKALHRYRWAGTSPDGAEFSWDRVMLAISRDGFTARTDVFDPDQIDAARRLMEGEAPTVGRAIRGYAEVFNTRDWDRFTEFFLPEFFLVDHRQAAFGRRDVQTFVETMTVMVDLAPDVQVHPEPVFTSSSGDVVILHLRGETREGGEFALDIGVAVRVQDGMGAAGITFEPADAAVVIPWVTDHSIGFEREDFEALRRATASPHAVVSAVQRIVELGHAGDWAGVADVIAEDVLYEDHRSLMRTTSSGRDVLLEAVRYQLHDGGRLDVEVVEDRGPKLALARVLKRLGRFGESEIPVLIIYGFDGGGRLSHALLFSEDDVDAARARLDAVAGGPSVHTPPGAGLAERNRRLLEAVEAGAELSEQYSPDFQWRDHWNHVELDLEGHLEIIRRVTARPSSDLRLDVVVGLGARHGVQRTTLAWHQDDGVIGASELSFLSVIRLDDRGRLLLGETFPPEQLHRALARAEELYLEDEATGEAAAGARRRLQLWRMVDAHNDGEWDALAQTLAPDAETVDHRAIGWATLHGRDAFIEALRAVFARSTMHSWRISDVHAIADDGCVYTLPTEGIDHDGGRYEQGGVVVAMLGDEGATRIEVFPFDAVDAARKRFAELHAGSRIIVDRSQILRGHLSNAYTEVYDRWIDAARRREWEVVARLYSPDAVLADLGTGLQQSLSGLGEILSNQRGAGDLGFGIGRVETIATRGDHLALHRTVWTAHVDSEVEMLLVGELGSDGRIARTVVFDADDLGRALEELDTRYARSLSSEEQAVLQHLSRTAAAYTAHDWDTYAAAFHDDVVVVDHRPAGWGTVEGIQGFLALIRGLVELVPDARAMAASIEQISAAGVHATVRMSGRDGNGAPAEIVYRSVLAYRDGVFTRDDRFPVEADAVARRRFEGVSSPDTTLSRALDRLIAALNARDTDALRDVHHPTFRYVDHTWHLDLDREEQLDNLERVFSASSSTSGWWLRRAVSLGDRHGVAEMQWHQQPGRVAGDREVANWHAFRCDGHGRILRTEVYGQDDLLHAMERAEAMYFDDEAAGPEAEASRHRLDLWRAFIADNEGDWETWRSLVDPEVVVVDRSPLGWGEVDGDGVRQRQEALQELTGRAQIRLRSVAIDGDVVMVHVVGEGRNDQGGLFEIVKWVIQVGAGYQEHFSADQQSEAARRFRELAEDARRRGEEPPPTTFVRVWQRLVAAWSDRDIDAVGSLLAPDYHCYEHLHQLEMDRDAVLADSERVGAGPGCVQSKRVLPFGDRHGVADLTWSMPGDGNAGDSYVSVWRASRCDIEERFVAVEVFPEDSLLAALHRAEELYLEDEATGDEAVWSRRRLRFWRCAAAYNAGDWDGVRAGFRPDLVTVDHRPTGWGRLEERDRYLETIHALAGITDRRRWVITSVQFHGPHLLLGLDVQGTDTDGGSFVLPFLAVLEIGDDGIVRQDLYLPEQRSEAQRRFAELLHFDPPTVADARRSGPIAERRQGRSSRPLGPA